MSKRQQPMLRVKDPTTKLRVMEKYRCLRLRTKVATPKKI